MQVQLPFLGMVTGVHQVYCSCQNGHGSVAQQGPNASFLKAPWGARRARLRPPLTLHMHVLAREALLVLKPRNMLAGFCLDYFLRGHAKLVTILGALLIFAAVLTMLRAQLGSHAKAAAAPKGDYAKDGKLCAQNPREPGFSKWFCYLVPR